MRIVKAMADGTDFDFENGKKIPMFEHFVALFAEKV
jgi:hypothetical protein